MSYGTNTSGGFLVPSFLDPAIYLTNGGANSPIPKLSRNITIATHDWNGVTSDGVTMSWDAEWSEVSDDSPTLASVNIPTFKAAGFVAASFELTEDSDIAQQVPELFTDARDRLEAAAFNTGNGTTAPTGIWTAIHADAAQRVVSTTAATVGLADLQSVYTTLPVRWRPNSTWLMNPLAQSTIQALGTAVSASYTTDATAVPDKLLTRPIATDDYAPYLSTTTALDSRIMRLLGVLHHPPRRHDRVLRPAPVRHDQRTAARRERLVLPLQDWRQAGQRQGVRGARRQDVRLTARAGPRWAVRVGPSTR